MSKEKYYIIKIDQKHKINKSHPDVQYLVDFNNLNSPAGCKIISELTDDDLGLILDALYEQSTFIENSNGFKTTYSESLKETAKKIEILINPLKEKKSN